MATKKIPESLSYEQGLIKYLFECSQLSRDNIFLREMNDEGKFKEQLDSLMELRATAMARKILVEWIDSIYPIRRGHRPTTVTPEAQDATIGEVVDESKLDLNFHKRDDSNATRKGQSAWERSKWELYFQKWGCVSCQDTTVPYASNGMCAKCRARTYARLRDLDYERLRSLEK